MMYDGRGALRGKRASLLVIIYNFCGDFSMWKGREINGGVDDKWRICGTIK